VSRLYLSCGLCGRKQADGLLSRAHWGHLEVGSETALCACPSCKDRYTDWELRLRTTVTSGSGRIGSVYGSDYRR
jgi:hypothetical protein